MAILLSASALAFPPTKAISHWPDKQKRSEKRPLSSDYKPGKNSLSPANDSVVEAIQTSGSQVTKLATRRDALRNRQPQMAGKYKHV